MTDKTRSCNVILMDMKRLAKVGVILAVTSVVAACQSDGLITGSTSPNTKVHSTGHGGQPPSSAERTAGTQRQLADWEKRYRKRPGNKANALGYAYLLRRAGQPEPALTVLQHATVKHPDDREVTVAYGKALGSVGRTEEATKILKRAENASQADWDFMSTMGAMHDQLGDHETARDYYRKALALAPGEPRILSNLGLSYALTRDLDLAEKTLRSAASQPAADNRVRQNLALVLGLQGKFAEAEDVARKDLPPAEAAQNVATLKQMLSQENTWQKIKSAG